MEAVTLFINFIFGAVLPQKIRFHAIQKGGNSVIR